MENSSVKNFEKSVTMLLVKARFVGKNRELGYIKTECYHLVFTITKSSFVQIKPVGYTSGEVCKYRSLREFLDDWEVLENGQIGGKF